MSKALFAGSFDPLTLGHIDIINRASKLYDELVVAVVVNINKESLFSLAERTSMLKDSCKELSNVRIDKVEGLLADYVNTNDIDVVIRGLRDAKDFEYELEMAHYNSNLYDKAETVFLMTTPEFSYISSTGVRELVRLKGNLETLVPDSVNKYIQKWRKENE